MIKWIFISVLLCVTYHISFAETTEERIALYGDYCPLCGAYGYCSKQPTKKEIVNALESYYSPKELKVVLIKHDGRFAEAEVYKNKKMVDKILLDCRTGRIRSIY